MTPGSGLERLAEEPDLTRVGSQKAGQELECGRLSRAVGPDVAEDLTLTHLEIEVDEGGAERLTDVADAVALGQPSRDQGWRLLHAGKV